MYDDIDFKKMIEQEPDLKEYFQEVLTTVFLADKNSRDMIKAIYNFREMGMEPQQVAKWILGMQPGGGPQ